MDTSYNSDTDENYESFETLTSSPSFVLDIFNSITEFLATYGWYLLGFCAIIIYNWENILTYIDKLQSKRIEKDFEAKCKRDPDLLQRRLKEMELARKRMQEELDRKAELYAVKLREREDQKRAALLAASTLAVGHKLGSSSPTVPSKQSATSKKSFGSEYHPLMGNGGSGGYRPPRRGCPGGGCG